MKGTLHSGGLAAHLRVRRSPLRRSLSRLLALLAVNLACA
jgi:hypothetical protein